MLISFVGKRAIVTGASRGIGKEIAIQLASCGAEVFALARNQEDLHALELYPQIHTYEVDITDWKTTSNVLNEIGCVDLLVNNAAVAMLGNILNITEAEIDYSFDLNVKAVIQITQHFAKQLIARSLPGAIVNISSQASMAGLRDHGVYSATKGALDAFTRVCAVELGEHNIRVNTINPTVIMTDMGKLGWSDPNKSGPMLEKLPLGRFGEVGEVADAVLYLLSSKASLITGISMPVDAGYLAA